MAANSTPMECNMIVDLESPDNSNNGQLPHDMLDAKISCQLDYFLDGFSPFIKFVQASLSYGTSIIICVGILTNLLSIAVLCQKRMRRSSSNMFLFILAVFDILSLILNFMIGVIRGQNLSANQSFLDSQALCKIHGMFVVVFNLSSVWIIATFSVVRFLIVKFPLKAKNFTTSRTVVIIFFVSLVVFAFSCHKLFVTGFEGDSVFGYKGCKTDRIQVPNIGRFYVAFNTWLPTLLILCFNIAIIREIKIYRSKRMAMTNNSSKSDDKSTRLLLIVSFTYLALVLPLGIIQTIELFWNEKINDMQKTDPFYVDARIIKLKLKWVRAFFFFFYQINFAINFFLYMLSSSGVAFQVTLKKLFGMKAREPVSETQATMTTAASNAVAPSGTGQGQEQESG